MSGVSFGEALEDLRDGLRVSRKGWNGTGMYVVLQKGYPDGIPINGNTAEATGLPEGTVRAFRPYLMMYTADEEFVPWVASQTDLLAEDWQEGPNGDEDELEAKERAESDREDIARLRALEAAGVDNWEGYDHAMAILRGED